MFTGGIVQSTKILLVLQKCDVSRLLLYIASHIDIAILIIAIENFSLSPPIRERATNIAIAIVGSAITIERAIQKNIETLISMIKK